MKLNLGAGEMPVADFISRDGKTGDILFPLPEADGTVEAIRASHVLEHFPHGRILSVLRDWVRALQPGGLLKIAVPDFTVIARAHLEDSPLPVGACVMGGQVDELDYHKSIFDEAQLTALMRAAGLVSIRRWKSEIEDCAALPISLNLQGNKPAKLPKISAVISMPRLGFNDFWAAAYSKLAPLGITIRKATGAYWDRDLVKAIKQTLAEDDPDWILTLDYDSIFTEIQLIDLFSLPSRYPHADAIAPLQVARWHKSPMFTCRDADGKLVGNVSREVLINGEMLRAETAHFGLTLLRASAIRELPKPWFKRDYAVDGDVEGDGAMDPDVYFWHNWKAAGRSLYVALRVPLGHADLTVRWPDINLEAMYQLPGDFWKNGPPADVWR